MRIRNPEILRAFIGRGPGRLMTGAELSRKIGKSRSTVDHLLNGRMETCTAEVAQAIEGVLGVPPGIIFLSHHEQQVTMGKPACC